MSTRVRITIALVLVAVVAAVAIGVFGRDGKPQHVGLPIGSEGISVRTSISPRAQLFGDSVVVHLELLVDRELINPNTITVATNFAPYRLKAKLHEQRVDYDRVTRLSYSVPLECLEDACTPQSSRKDFQFAPAQVRSRNVVLQRPRWPKLTIGSRLQTPSSDNSDVRNQRLRGPSGLDWRAELRVASPTWRIAPMQATVLLVGLALALLAASFLLVTLAYPGLATRLWRRPAKISPLEHALVVLQRASESGVEEEHRVALDDLATELRALGARDLAGTAYALAWDEPSPARDRTAGLSQEVRELITGSTNGHP